MQTFRFEIVPQPYIMDLPDYRDGKARRRDRRKKARKN